MDYLTIGLLLFSILLIIIIVSLSKKKNKVSQEFNELKNKRKEELKDYYSEEAKVYQKELELEKENKKHNVNSEIISLEHRVANLKVQLNEKEHRYNEVNQDLEVYRKEKIKEIDTAANQYKEKQNLIIDKGIDEYRALKNKQFNEYLNSLYEQKNEAFDELSKIRAELTEEFQKRAAINKEILRQRTVQEQQDFYRIQLNEEDTQDIEILRSVVHRLRYPEAINKAIWSTYYQKPLAELRKRLLSNGDISGIYKITRIKTGEIYIGQTTSIDKRWQEHVKTALGVGNLTSSQLHRIMREDGPENFTFEILEETPKDKLREREAFYIDFYDSKTYGLNTVKGNSK